MEPHDLGDHENLPPPPPPSLHFFRAALSRAVRNQSGLDWPEVSIAFQTSRPSSRWSLTEKIAVRAFAFGTTGLPGLLRIIVVHKIT